MVLLRACRHRWLKPTYPLSYIFALRKPRNERTVMYIGIRGSNAKYETDERAKYCLIALSLCVLGKITVYSKVTQLLNFQGILCNLANKVQFCSNIDQQGTVLLIYFLTFELFVGFSLHGFFSCGTRSSSWMLFANCWWTRTVRASSMKWTGNVCTLSTTATFVPARWLKSPPLESELSWVLFFIIFYYLLEDLPSVHISLTKIASRCFQCSLSLTFRYLPWNIGRYLTFWFLVCWCV